MSAGMTQAEQKLWSRVDALHTGLELELPPEDRAQTVGYLGLVTDELLHATSFVRRATVLGRRTLADEVAAGPEVPGASIIEGGGRLKYPALTLADQRALPLPKDPLTTALSTRNITTYGQLEEALMRSSAPAPAPRVPVVFDTSSQHILHAQSGLWPVMLETHSRTIMGTLKGNGSYMPVGQIRIRVLERMIGALRDQPADAYTSKELVDAVKDVLGISTPVDRNVYNAIITWLKSDVRVDGQQVIKQVVQRSERRRQFAINSLFRVFLRDEVQTAK
ncbi:MAG TPA: hypothetical protein VLI54_04330 [Bacillota bacterium]|nr:hypothetical protein [Bacillota bacterium]